MLKEAGQTAVADRETDKQGDAAHDLRSEATSPPMVVPAALTDHLWQTAEKRASAYAPPPEHDPLIAGMTGLTVALVVVMVFLAFAGLDGTAFASAIAWTGLIGFLAPFLYFKHQARKHIRAFARELAALRSEQ
jgi:Flp pilus assembly protein TadB